MLRGTVKAAESAADEPQGTTQLHQHQAPISGRISAAIVKVGNFVRPADTAPLATINQIKPVYVSFAVPQRMLADVRQARDAGTGRVEANVPGQREPSTGRLNMIDNSADVASGMVPVRAIMENEDEALWPGTLVNVDAHVARRGRGHGAVGRSADRAGRHICLRGQGWRRSAHAGDRSRAPSKARRSISKGLSGGETVVTDGQLLLANGTKVAPRQPAQRAGGVLMGISELCIRRPVLTTLITASLIVFGIFAYRLLAVAALAARGFPDHLDHRHTAGREPRDDGGVRRFADRAPAVDDRRHPSMTSSSSLGTTQITIQFDLNRNIDSASLDVQTALTVAQRRLPIEMTTPPSFRKVNPGDFPILFIALASDTLPLSDRQRICGYGAGAADFADSRRRPGPDLRRAEIRGARTGRPRGGGGARACRSTISARR